MPLWLPPAPSLDIQQAVAQLGGPATYRGLPLSNMPLAAGGQNLGAQTANDIQGGSIWLPAGAVVTKVAFLNRTTAGATLTHRWVGIYSKTGSTLFKQSTDDTTATTSAQTMLQHTLTSTWTVPADDYYLVGLYIAGTTIPTISGASLGIAGLAQVAITGGAAPSPMPFAAFHAAVGSATGTAPASITPTTIVSQFQFWVY